MKTLALLLSITLSSCCTIVNGSRQDLLFTTHPGSTAKVINSSGINVGECTTPCQIRVRRSKALLKKEFYRVEYTKDGELISEEELRTTLNPWLLGNIFLYGGLTGLILDASSGSLYRIKQ